MVDHFAGTIAGKSEYRLVAYVARVSWIESA